MPFTVANTFPAWPIDFRNPKVLLGNPTGRSLCPAISRSLPTGFGGKQGSEDPDYRLGGVRQSLMSLSTFSVGAFGGTGRDGQLL